MCDTGFQVVRQENLKKVLYILLSICTIHSITTVLLNNFCYITYGYGICFHVDPKRRHPPKFWDVSFQIYNIIVKNLIHDQKMMSLNFSSAIFALMQFPRFARYEAQRHPSWSWVCAGIKSRTLVFSLNISLQVFFYQPLRPQCS